MHFVPIERANSSVSSTSTPHLARPLAIRYEAPRLDRADPRGTHQRDERPRRNLRSRSHSHCEFVDSRPLFDTSPILLKTTTHVVQRPQSPALSSASFGSAVTPEAGEPRSSDWSDPDVTAASPIASDLSDRAAAARSWRYAPRTLSCTLTPAEGTMLSQNSESDLAPIAPALWLSQPDLRYARCMCMDNRPAHRSLPRSCNCRHYTAPTPSRTPTADVIPPGVKSSPDKRLLRFLKKRLSWKMRK